MNEATLYERVNWSQLKDSKEALNSYANLIRWRKDGHGSLLDVGCGSGNVLIENVLPLLDSKYEKVTGIDISVEMIKFASKKYEQHKRVNFRLLDITTEQLPDEFIEQYDHVTSFYCLHWVRNQEKALANIYKMLRFGSSVGGGDCFLLICITHPLYDIYRVISKYPQWASHMQHLVDELPPLYYSQDPAAEYADIMHKVGFVNCQVEVVDKVFVYESVNSFKDFVRSICQFMTSMSEEEQATFLSDFVNIAINMNLHEPNEHRDDVKFIMHYKLLLVYAHKPGGNK